MIRTKWTRFAGLRFAGVCALLTLALPGVTLLTGHHELASQHSDAELKQHALELNFLSILCLIFVLLYLASQRPVAHVPAPAIAGYAGVETPSAVLASRPRLSPSRGPPA